MQLALLNDTIAGYERYLTLTMNRFNGGVASRADVTLGANAALHHAGAGN